MKAEDKARAVRETRHAISTGGDLRALALRLQREMGYPYRQLMTGILWLAKNASPAPKPRCRYDWFLQKWVEGERVDAVAIGGPLHGRRVEISRLAQGMDHRGELGRVTRYVRQDFTHIIPYPQRYTALVAEGSSLPPSYEIRGLAARAGAIRWAGHEEQMRISCLASGVRYGEAG